jgi:hypothetical protein
MVDELNKAVLENLGAGLLIFNQQDKLIYDNVTARRILGANLVLVRSEGWSVMAMFIDANAADNLTVKEIRTRAQQQKEPVRFGILLGGSYAPCWMAVYEDADGERYTQIVIQKPDWTPLTELMGTFRAEARTAVTDTNGHAEFIRKLLSKPPAGISAQELGQKAIGMVDLISTKMHRLQLLVDLLHRLEIIRTGQLATVVEQSRTKIDFEDFFEDFMEELNEQALVDPGTPAEEYRQRLVLDIDEDLYVMAPRSYLRNILRDILRNAFMYSESGTPVKLQVTLASQGRNIQFDVTDEGCGVRPREGERVFEPFQRARQPQIIREHGYGLSLYLCKNEIEAMGGRIWFESEEGVGSTFSFKLPTYRGE